MNLPVLKWPVAALLLAASLPVGVALFLSRRHRWWGAICVAVFLYAAAVLIFKRRKLDEKSRDAFAALVHMCSAVALAASAIAVTGGLETGRRYWIRTSWSVEPRKWHTTNSSEQFYVSPPSDVLIYVQALWLSLAYAFWSACVHVARVKLDKPSSEKDNAWIKWLDYCVTAPIMLLVIGLLFGVETAWLLVSAGGLVAALAIAGAAVEDKGRPLLLAALLLVYAALWYPLVAAFHKITVDDGDNSTGTAPPFVPVFGGLMVLLFTSFAGIFVWDMCLTQEGLKDRELYYYGASLISKTSLHLFIGLSAIAQTRTLGVHGREQPHSMSETDTLGYGIGGCVLLVIVLAVVTATGFAEATKKPPEAAMLLLNQMNW